MSGRWNESLHQRRTRHEEDLIQVAPPSPVDLAGKDGDGGGGGKITLLRSTTTTTTTTVTTSFLAMKDAAKLGVQVSSGSGSNSGAGESSLNLSGSSGKGGVGVAKSVVGARRRGKLETAAAAVGRLPRVRSMVLQGFVAFTVLCLPGNFIALWVTERNHNETEYASAYRSVSQTVYSTSHVIDVPGK